MFLTTLWSRIFDPQGVEEDDRIDCVERPVLPLAGLALGHDLRIEGAVAVARHLEIDRAILSQHGLGIAAVAMIVAAAAGRVALLVAEVVGQLRPERPFQQRLLQLLEQAIFAEQVFRLLVAGQQFVQMFWFDRHRESPSFRLPTDRPHTIYLTLPTCSTSSPELRPLLFGYANVALLSGRRA